MPMTVRNSGGKLPLNVLMTFILDTTVSTAAARKHSSKNRTSRNSAASPNDHPTNAWERPDIVNIRNAVIVLSKPEPGGIPINS
ncbi:signal peptidase complex catalytic subunit SEC11 [Penicillium paradoxum]|uniref:signal peptidase complex catalytic subunit SEC11 n=1 Tax=Penicillium paradoxum TaxID=176176 RepID=UPI002548AC56|nr:signal peptidase complex catalytic subunit SEC11 [Penicillium paradoxum]KAJ5778835.1 signal peptidase complex catalytic subunit SEC11 [Penicillium paradoxum]